LEGSTSLTSTTALSLRNCNPLPLFLSLTNVNRFTTKYPIEGQLTSDGKQAYEKFSFGFAIPLFQNLFCFIVAALVNRLYYKQYKSNMDLKSELLIAVTGFISAYLTSLALSYVSFPIQAIMKSSKIISILAVSLILRVKGQHTKSQYFCGVVITLGIILFNLSQEKGGKSDDNETSLIGIVAIVISLFCDGLLGVTQGKVKLTKTPPSAWDQMESLNKYSLVICFFIALVSGQFAALIAFVKVHPIVMSDLVLLSVSGTIGQVFIFYTIANFSPLLLSIVTTTRKFFTVLISIFIFNHQMNYLQWISIGLVFLGVFMEMLGGSQKGAKKVEKSDKDAKKVDSEPESEEEKKHRLIKEEAAKCIENDNKEGEIRKRN
jgi:UDP-galactose transporter B1